MKNKLIPLILILFLTPPPIHPSQLIPKKAPRTKKVRTTGRLGLVGKLPEGFQRYVLGIRYFPQRKVIDIKKDLVEFYGYTDPKKTTFSPDKELQDMFVIFKDITKHVLNTMGTGEVDFKTGKIINAKGRRGESYEYMRKLIIKNLLGGDTKKLTQTDDGKRYLKNFAKEAERIHYDTINEILYLEKEIFAMLQAISYEAAQQSYLAKINAAFEELLNKYKKDFARIEKQLNQLITKVLGPKKGSHDFSLIWKALLTAKYPVRKKLSYLYAAYFPDRKLIYKELIRNREEVYKRLVYLAMEKFATVLTELAPSPAVMENIVKEYTKQVNPYIKRPRVFKMFRRNKFDAWKRKIEKSLGSLAKRIKKLDCFKKWENFAKCEAAVDAFDEQIKIARAEFDALYDEAESQFGMAAMLQVAQKELLGDLEERMRKFPEQQTKLRKEIDALKVKFTTLKGEEEKLEKKAIGQQKTRKKELDDEEIELNKTLAARKKVEQDEKEATRGAWKRSEKAKERVELKKKRREEIRYPEERYRPSYLRDEPEERPWLLDEPRKKPSLLDIFKKKPPRRLTPQEKAGQERRKELAEEVELAAGIAKGTRKRNLGKIKSAVKAYPPDKVDTIVSLLDDISKKPDKEIEKLPKKLEIMGNLEKLKKDYRRRAVGDDINQLMKVVKFFPTEYIDEIAPKLKRVGSKSSTDIRALADELSKTSGHDEKESLIDQIKQVKGAPAKRPLTSYLDEIEELVKLCPPNKLDVLKDEVDGIANKTNNEIKYLPQQLKSLLVIEKTRRQSGRKGINKALDKLEEMVRAYPTGEAFEYAPKLADLDKKSNKEIEALVPGFTKDFQAEQKETTGELIGARRKAKKEKEAIAEQQDDLAELQQDEQELSKLREQILRDRDRAIQRKDTKQTKALNVQLEIITQQQKDLRGDIQELIDRNKQSTANLTDMQRDAAKLRQVLEEMAGVGLVK